MITSPESISYPIGVRQAFHARCTETGLLDRLDQMVGNCRDMTMRSSRRDHHVVAEARSALNVDGDGCFSALESSRLARTGFEGAGRFRAYPAGEGAMAFFCSAVLRWFLSYKNSRARLMPQH